MNSQQAMAPVSPELWKHARHRAADVQAACPQEAFDQFANQYRHVEQLKDSPNQVLALTIYALAATSGRAAGQPAPSHLLCQTSLAEQEF